VGHVTNAQVWTVIAMMFTFFGVTLAVIRSSPASLQKVREARFDAVDARFDAIDARFRHEREYATVRFDYCTVRFDALDHRLGVVESDLSIIKSHLIGQRFASRTYRRELELVTVFDKF
jgi:hypothetical protein